MAVGICSSHTPKCVFLSCRIWLERSVMNSWDSAFLTHSQVMLLQRSLGVSGLHTSCGLSSSRGNTEDASVIRIYLTLNPLEGQFRSWVRRRARGLNTFCCSLPTELAVALLGGPEARQCCSGQPYCYPTPYLPFFPSLFLLNDFPTLSQSAPEMLFIFF